METITASPWRRRAAARAREGHRVGGSRGAQLADELRGAKGVADAQAGQAPGLGQRADDHGVGQGEGGGGEVFVGELGIGQIDEQQGDGGCQAPEVVGGGDAAGRVVRAGDHGDLGPLGDRREDGVGGVALGGPGHLDDGPAGEGRVAGDHLEARSGQDQLAAAAQGHAADPVEGVVAAGGDQDLGGVDAEAVGEQAGELGGVGVAAQALGLAGEHGAGELWLGSAALVSVEVQVDGGGRSGDGVGREQGAHAAPPGTIRLGALTRMSVPPAAP